jgi:hypothetical protein
MRARIPLRPQTTHENSVMSYIIEQPEGGVPIKMWTQGVPVEPEAKQQLANAAKLPIVFKHIAAMPDVHPGISATVGSVIPTLKAIIPAAVGVDIGCGMMAAKTTLRAEDLPDNLGPLRSAIEYLTAAPVADSFASALNLGSDAGGAAGPMVCRQALGSHKTRPCEGLLSRSAPRILKAWKSHGPWRQGSDAIRTTSHRQTDSNGALKKYCCDRDSRIVSNGAVFALMPAAALVLGEPTYAFTPGGCTHLICNSMILLCRAIDSGVRLGDTFEWTRVAGSPGGVGQGTPLGVRTRTSGPAMGLPTTTARPPPRECAVVMLRCAFRPYTRGRLSKETQEEKGPHQVLRGDKTFGIEDSWIDSVHGFGFAVVGAVGLQFHRRRSVA